MAQPVVISLPRPTPTFTPMFVAVDRGFLADAGLDATIEYGRGRERVLSGDVDFFPGGLGRGGLYEDTGLIMVCGTATRVQPHVLMARPGIETAEQLRLVLMTDAEGGGLDKELRTILAHNGVDFDQADIGITRYAGGHPEQYRALKEGIGDAAPLGPPWWMSLSKEGYKNMGAEADYTPNLSCTGIHVTPEKIAKNPDQVTAFVRAFARSVRFCQENVPETLETMMKFGWGVDTREIAQEVYDLTSPYWSVDVDLAVIERLLKRTAEKLGQAPEPDSFLELRFLTEARRTI